MKQLFRFYFQRGLYPQNLWHWTQLGLVILPFSPLLAVLVLLGVAFRVWQQHHRTIVRRPLNWGLAILGVWLVITAALAFDRLTALVGLFNFLPFFWLFAGLSALIQAPVQLRQLSWALVLTSVPVMLIGLGQLFGGWAGHPQLLWIVLDLVIDRGGNPLGRMSSLFTYANVLASYFVMILPLAIGLWIESYQALPSESISLLKLRQLMARRQIPRSGPEKSAPLQQLDVPQNQAWLRWALLSLLVVGDTIALILTDSRNAWAIAVLACLAFALYQGWRWLVAGVGVIAGSVLWAAFGPAPTQPWFRAIVPAFFWARLSDQRYPDRPVALLRVTQWRFAWSLTEQRPWTGWGLRNFTPLYQAQMHTFIGHPHNLVLMMTAETGIPATLVLLGLVGWVMFRGVLLLRDWPNLFAQPVPRWTSDRLIFFSYLVAFGASTLFHLLDVTLFDARINILGWVLLSAICGLVYRQQAMLLQQKAIAADFEPS